MHSVFKYILAALCLLLISCEEIIDLDLAEMEPRIVIDASISEGMPCRVILTQTQGFNENTTDIVRIEGAEVSLTDSRGRTEVLQMSRYQGVYVSSMSGIAGLEYTLTVSYEGKTYESKATIPRIVYLDDIYIYNIKVGETDWYSPCIVYYDPPEIENYYHSLMYVNGNPMRMLYLHDDEFNDGLLVQQILYFDPEQNGNEELKLGDNIMVELYSLDKGSYTYYNSIDKSSGGNNPTSNIEGEVLGCFKAYNMSMISMTITEDRIYTP